MKKFLKDLLERAVGTFAATAVALLVAEGAGAGLESVNWVSVVSVAGLATVLTVLKGLAAKYTGDPESASLVDSAPVEGVVNKVKDVFKK